MGLPSTWAHLTKFEIQTIPTTHNTTMTAETSLPLKITISMGDVSFSLTPTSDDQPSLSSSDFRSPSQRRSSSSRQDANHRTSPPILSIRQGTSSSPSTSHRSIRRSSFASKGHVREMKENIELQQRGQQRRSSGFSSSQADGSLSSTGYSVDLHEFTGTLQIIPSKQNNEQNTISYSPPRKRRHTKKRNSSSLVVNRIHRKQNNEVAEMIDESATKKSVQFSLPKERHSIGKNVAKNKNVAEEVEIEHLHSPVQEKLSIAKSILSPPLSVLASPPQKVVQATAKIARGTSSALARSSKLAFKQIADAYDRLHGAPPNYAAHINELSHHSSFDSIENEYDAIDGTEYHYACASDNLEKIRRLLDGIEGDELFFLWKTDCNGKLPLHVLTENSQLIEKYPMECEDVTMSMVELMGPANLVYALHPNSNWAPFIYIIGKWTEKLHRNVNTTGGGATSSSVRDTTKSNRLQIHLPTNVRLTHNVTWAICLLSRLIDEYPEETREFIMTNLATVPLFLKSVLLCGDSSLLETSLVKHAALDKRSINVWLITLLTSTTESRFQAVTFIKLLSRLTLVSIYCNC